MSDSAEQLKKIEDPAFAAFVRACMDRIEQPADLTAVRSEVASLTEGFARSWRMTDPRYRRLQPEAPYASYLLFLSPGARLNIVLDIFAPGQAAAVHNHRTWGVFVCLEGKEIERRYAVPANLSSPPVETEVRENLPGVVRTADPERHCFHQVETTEATSISLHLYGADIGRIERDRWDVPSGRFVTFRSGYSNEALNLPPYFSWEEIDRI